MADDNTIGDDINIVVKPSPTTIRFALIVTSPASMRSTSLTSSPPILRCSASAPMLSAKSGHLTIDRLGGSQPRSKAGVSGAPVAPLGQKGHLASASASTQMQSGTDMWRDSRTVGWRTSDRYRGESATHVVDGEDKATMTAMDEAEAPSKVELSLPRLCYQWRGRHPRLHICHLSWPPPYCPQIPPPIGADTDAKRRKGHSTIGGAGTDVRVTRAPTTLALSQDAKRHEMSGDEAGKTLLVEVVAS
uniref:Uncharacterized protein n=1 Tax=Musa acuminata TaxID=4641 RepID=Q1EP76_MUSAC|nr:hypothetical protein MA4_54B05.26 [Musa acuminata]